MTRSQIVIGSPGSSGDSPRPGDPMRSPASCCRAELETDAQVNFERYGGFNKGRPMHPVGIAFRNIGSGEPALSVARIRRGRQHGVPDGSATGHRRLRQPARQCHHPRRRGNPCTVRASPARLDDPALAASPFTWHYHRRTDEELEEQMFGYAAGLTGFCMSWLLASPTSALGIARLIPRGVRRISASRNADDPDGAPAGFPEHLLRAGQPARTVPRAWMYLREIRHQRRYSAPHDDSRRGMPGWSCCWWVAVPGCRPRTRPRRSSHRWSTCPGKPGAVADSWVAPADARGAVEGPRLWSSGGRVAGGVPVGLQCRRAAHGRCPAHSSLPRTGATGRSAGRSSRWGTGRPASTPDADHLWTPT